MSFTSHAYLLNVISSNYTSQISTNHSIVHCLSKPSNSIQAPTTLSSLQAITESTGTPSPKKFSWSKKKPTFPVQEKICETVLDLHLDAQCHQLHLHFKEFCSEASSCRHKPRKPVSRTHTHIISPAQTQAHNLALLTPLGTQIIPFSTQAVTESIYRYAFLTKHHKKGVFLRRCDQIAQQFPPTISTREKPPEGLKGHCRALKAASLPAQATKSNDNTTKTEAGKAPRMDVPWLQPQSATRTWNRATNCPQIGPLVVFHFMSFMESTHEGIQSLLGLNIGGSFPW